MINTIFFEEKIINGVLCWRMPGSTVWLERTQQELTELLLEARAQAQNRYYPLYYVGDFLIDNDPNKVTCKKE